MADARFLLIGLGNPGQEYHLTRHNAGFYFVDELARRQGAAIETSKMNGLYAQCRLGGRQVFYLKPQTYMNRSGECVRGFADYFKIPASHMLVLHDDIDLALGRIKLVARGGAGGHNGIRSLIQHLGGQDFARMKIGIGRPAVNAQGQGQPVEQFVLARMSEDELALLNERYARVEEAVRLFIEQGIEVCMNRINGR